VYLVLRSQPIIRHSRSNAGIRCFRQFPSSTVDLYHKVTASRLDENCNEKGVEPKPDASKNQPYRA
jgi:hypothetical protein